jgi:uncharacterized membrane protein
MDEPGAARAIGSVTAGVVLVATGLVLAAGLLLKAPCATGNWGDGRQYRKLCYSDIVPLYGTEQLAGGRIPYLDRCSGAETCDEYPVLTMFFMRAAAWMADIHKAVANGPAPYGSFFYVNVVLLSGCALLTAWLLWLMVGARALYFALAPTLLLYGFMNWDLLAVALATAGTYAYLRSRDGPAGALLGLGAAAKLYPGLLVVPFALGRLKEGRREGAGHLVTWSVVAFAAANLPFALAAPHSWATFFRFNTTRPVDWDSLWYGVCQRIHGGVACPWSARLINGASLALFLALAAGLWALRRARDPDFPRWTFGFPLIVAFLLTNKVYSPQYGLWLLPWFALALPNPWLFGAFELADVAVFATRFTWFGRLSHDYGQPQFFGYHGVPLGAFELAVAVRAAILVACLAAWVGGSERIELRLPARHALEPGVAT